MVEFYFIKFKSEFVQINIITFDKFKVELFDKKVITFEEILPFLNLPTKLILFFFILIGFLLVFSHGFYFF